MQRLRSAIDVDDIQRFLTEFLREQFGGSQAVPEWVRNAMSYAGYPLVEEEDE